MAIRQNGQLSSESGEVEVDAGFDGWAVSKA